MTIENNVIHGLFLLFEGLPKTIIESQVITSVVALKNYGVDMEIWSFAVTKNAFVQAKKALPDFERRYPTATIRVFRGVRPAMPLSEYLNAALLFFHMRQHRATPQFIHARTEHATMIAALIKNFLDFKLIWDARGDAASEFLEGVEYLSKYLKPFYKIKLSAIRNRISKARRNCDFGFFVSDALRELQAPALPKEKTLITPCLADESKFFWSPDLREATRESLNIAEDEIVLIYVGSMTFWQCIPETVELIEKTLITNEHAKAIVITPDVEKFGLLIEKELSDRVLIKSVMLDEVNAYLNAADYGILLRRNSEINWVASPVKFAEYCLTGLRVIAGNSVNQVMEYGFKIGNLIDPVDFKKLTLSKIENSKRKFLSESASEFFSSTNSLLEKSKCYKKL